MDVGSGGIGEAGRADICDDGAEDGVVGKEKSFLLVVPGGTSKAFEDSEP